MKYAPRGAAAAILATVAVLIGSIGPASTAEDEEPSIAPAQAGEPGPSAVSVGALKADRRSADFGEPMVGVSVANSWQEGFFGEEWGSEVSADPWAAVKQYAPERRPMAGWYQDTDQAVAEQQLRWMADYGIDYVSYGWVWNPDTGAASKSKASIDAYVNAPAQSDVAFSLLWDTSTPETRDQLTLEQWAWIVAGWLDDYLTRPEYLKIDGQPVVFTHMADDYFIQLAERLAQIQYGDAGQYLDVLVQLNAIADDLAQAKGLPGIYLVSGFSNSTAHWNAVSRDGGFDANSGYNHHNAPVGATGTAALSGSYLGLDQIYREHWNAGVAVPFLDEAGDSALQSRVLEMTAGWDATPLEGSAVSELYGDREHNQSQSTPAEFEEHLVAGRQFLSDNPALTNGMGKIFAWNEFMEGGYIEPTEESGFAYLEAVSRVFGNLDLSEEAWSAPTAGQDSWPVSVASDLRTWKAESSAPEWLGVSRGEGSYDGGFELSATRNTTDRPRTATVTVTAGGLSRTVEVTQAGAEATLARAAAKDDDAIVRPENFLMGIASHLGSSDGWAVRDSDGSSIQEIALTELGASTLRDELMWDYLGDSPENENVAMSQPAIERLKTVRAEGGKLLLVLDYGHRQRIDASKNEGFPATRDQREAFARYAIRAIETIGAENLAGLEIWNEWSSYMGWRGGEPGPVWGTPCPVAGAEPITGCPIVYGKLVEALMNPEHEGLATKSLRDVAPGVPVIVGASHAFDPQWTQPMLTYLREHDVRVDGYSTHPYASETGNGCAVNWTATPLDEAKAQCIKGARERVEEWYGQELPIYVTELGFTVGDPKITADIQAELLVKAFVRTRAVDDVLGVWWYDLLEDYPADASLYPNEADSMEGGYGLITRIGSRADHKAGAVKPAGIAYGALSRFWADCADVSGSPTANTYFELDCADGTRHVFLDATLGQLREAQAQGGTLVDLLGVKADLAPNSPVPADWAGQQVGVLGAKGGAFTVTLTGRAYRGETVRAATDIQGVSTFRWESRMPDGEWLAAAYAPADSASAEYKIGGPSGTGLADFQGANSVGKEFRVQALKAGLPVAEAFFRPATSRAVGSVGGDGVTSPEEGKIRIAADAWAFDGAALDEPGKLYASVGAQCGQPGAEGHGPLTANQAWRADQAVAYPQAEGSPYGFDATFDTALYG
ncbi:MAG: glycoside hydrolase family 99-like domain-containing protein, partial [Bifidobacteriaceae bacterium]|nr:glycoside hydrolase family 99-like domain-containing protein [Bifidobacteriaceae bacterium]